MKLAAALAALAVSLVHAQTPTDAATAFVARVLQAAIAQTAQRVLYDGSYRRIGYPGGDVAANVGVCTDLIVRAYRAAGDLRSADGLRPLVVHNVGNGPEVEDMLFRFPISGHYRYRGQ